MKNSDNPKDTFLFLDKRKRFIFSIKAGLAFLPLLFFMSLPIFNRMSLNPVGFLYETILPVYRTAGDICFVASLMSILFLVFVIVAIYLSLNKITVENISRLFYRLPFSYFIVISPIFLLYILLFIYSIFEGGESAIYAIVFAIGAISSILPIFYISIVLFLWIKKQKTLSTILVLSTLMTLSFVSKNLLLYKGCWPRDSVCLAQKAMDENDPDICRDSKDSSACFSYLAFLTGDSSYCQYVSRLNSFCYERVAVKNKNIELCEKISCGSSTCKDGCYARVYEAIAKDKLDLSLCDKAGSYRWAHGESMISIVDCYAEVAKEADDVRICDKLEGNKNREICYSSFALYKRDCSIIPDTVSGRKRKEICEESVRFYIRKGDYPEK